MLTFGRECLRPGTLERFVPFLFIPLKEKLLLQGRTTWAGKGVPGCAQYIYGSMSPCVCTLPTPGCVRHITASVATPRGPPVRLRVKGGRRPFVRGEKGRRGAPHTDTRWRTPGVRPAPPSLPVYRASPSTVDAKQRSSLSTQ